MTRPGTAWRGRFTGAAAAMVVALTACAPPEPQEVRLLAGGGDDHLNEVSGESSSGAEITLDGQVRHLTGRGDGTVWGIIEPGVVFAVDADGTTRARRATNEDGASVELVDVAAAPDGTVFVLPMVRSETRHLGGDSGAVYRLDDDNVVRPIAGVYGPVEDIATDSEGRLLILENVGDPRAGPRDHQPHQIRRVEPGGSLTTIAGADEVDGRRSEDFQTWFDLPDGTPALDLPLYRETGIAVDTADTVYLASDKSVAAVAASDGEIRRVGGLGAEGDEVDFETMSREGVEADIVGLRNHSSMSVNDDGTVVFNVRAVFDSDEVVPWQLDGGNESAQRIADGARDDPFGFWPTALVDGGGQARAVSILGHSAAWLDDDTLAISAWDRDEESIVVTIEAS